MLSIQCTQFLDKDILCALMQLVEKKKSKQPKLHAML